MTERDEGFLSRWSRLKQRTREETPAPQPDPASAAVPAPRPGAPADVSPDVPPEGEAGAAEDPNAGLPPIEELDRHSDYTAFMRAGVSPELRKQALHKLWRSDPVLANLDGLLEYGEDYSLPFKQGGVVSTIYRVGKGMVQAAEDEAPAPMAAAPDSDSPPDVSASQEATVNADAAPASTPDASTDDDSADANKSDKNA